MRGLQEEGAVWAAAISTTLSALLYLLDFGTNISALRTYYVYEYRCPHASLLSPLLHDPICSAIRSGGLSNYHLEFWALLGWLLVAHLVYSIVFCFTLDRRQHPFRLAYFLPLIHLYRLLKLLFHTLSCQDIKELVEAQSETSNLYNVIGASVETASQFFIQFILATKVGEYVKGSDVQKIPTNLIISLVVSLISASYNTSIVMLSLVTRHMSLTMKAYFCCVIGFHTLASMLAGTLCLVGFFRLSKTALPLPLMIYDISEVLIGWLFVDFFLQRHQYNTQGKNKYLRVAHSFGLSVMIRLIGPIYVIVKFSKSTYLIILGALLHVLVKLIGFSLVLYLPSHVQGLKSPCHAFHIKETNLVVEENKYFTCKILIATFLTSLLIFILTTMQIYWVQRGISARVFPSTCTTNPCGTHNNPTFTINDMDFIPIGSKDELSRQISGTTFFKLFLFVILIGIIQKLQMKRVL